MSRIFSFRGRLDRKHFIFGCILLVLFTFPFRAIFDLALHSLEPKSSLAHVSVMFQSIAFSQLFLQIIVIVGLVVILSVLVCVLSILVRRSHEFNISGWLVLLILAMIQIASDFSILSFAPSIASLALTLVMAIIPGTAGQNKYGA